MPAPLFQCPPSGEGPTDVSPLAGASHSAVPCRDADVVNLSFNRSMHAKSQGSLAPCGRVPDKWCSSSVCDGGGGTQQNTLGGVPICQRAFIVHRQWDVGLVGTPIGGRSAARAPPARGLMTPTGITPTLKCSHPMITHAGDGGNIESCLLYTSPSPRD